MQGAVVVRHVADAVAVGILERGHVPRNGVPALQLFAVFGQDHILKIFDGSAVGVLRHDGQNAVGHIGDSVQHLPAVKVCHNAVQLVVLQLYALTVLDQIDIRHLVQQQAVGVIGKVQAAAIQPRGGHEIRH